MSTSLAHLDPHRQWTNHANAPTVLRRYFPTKGRDLDRWIGRPIAL